MVAMSFGTTCRRGRHTSASGLHHVPRRARRCPRRHGGGPSEPVVVGRYYDPQTGQFLSVDPMVSQTLEPYQYVKDNPVGEVDPSGETFVGAYAQGNGFLCPAEPGLPICYASYGRPGGFALGRWIVDMARTTGKTTKIIAQAVVKSVRRDECKVLLATAGVLGAAPAGTAVVMASVGQEAGTALAVFAISGGMGSIAALGVGIGIAFSRC